jgi:hypothetical protein
LNSAKDGQSNKRFGGSEGIAEDFGVEEKNDGNGESGELIRQDIVQRTEGESPSLPCDFDVAETFYTAFEVWLESVELGSVGQEL